MESLKSVTFTVDVAARQFDRPTNHFATGEAKVRSIWCEAGRVHVDMEDATDSFWASETLVKRAVVAPPVVAPPTKQVPKINTKR